MIISADDGNSESAEILLNPFRGFQKYGLLKKVNILYSLSDFYKENKDYERNVSFHNHCIVSNVLMT